MALPQGPAPPWAPTDAQPAAGLRAWQGRGELFDRERVRSLQGGGGRAPACTTPPRRSPTAPVPWSAAPQPAPWAALPQPARAPAPPQPAPAPAAGAAPSACGTPRAAAASEARIAALEASVGALERRVGALEGLPLQGLSRRLQALEELPLASLGPRMDALERQLQQQQLGQQQQQQQPQRPPSAQPQAPPSASSQLRMIALPMPSPTRPRTTPAAADAPRNPNSLFEFSCASASELEDILPVDKFGNPVQLPPPDPAAPQQPQAAEAAMQTSTLMQPAAADLGALTELAQRLEALEHHLLPRLAALEEVAQCADTAVPPPSPVSPLGATLRATQTAHTAQAAARTEERLEHLQNAVRGLEETLSGLAIGTVQARQHGAEQRLRALEKAVGPVDPSPDEDLEPISEAVRRLDAALAAQRRRFNLLPDANPAALAERVTAAEAAALEGRKKQEEASAACRAAASAAEEAAGRHEALAAQLRQEVAELRAHSTAVAQSVGEGLHGLELKLEAAQQRAEAAEAEFDRLRAGLGDGGELGVLRNSIERLGGELVDLVEQRAREQEAARQEQEERQDTVLKRLAELTLKADSEATLGLRLEMDERIAELRAELAAAKERAAPAASAAQLPIEQARPYPAPQPQPQPQLQPLPQSPPQPQPQPQPPVQPQPRPQAPQLQELQQQPPQRLQPSWPPPQWEQPPPVPGGATPPGVAGASAQVSPRRRDYLGGMTFRLPAPQTAAAAALRADAAGGGEQQPPYRRI